MKEAIAFGNDEVAKVQRINSKGTNPKLQRGIWD
jgi:hypothetical protein